MAKNATFDQYLQLGRMVSAGKISCELMQAILEGHVEIIEKTSDYRMHVTYAPLQGVSALGPKFSGEDSVSALFDGRERSRHSSCMKIDEIPGERSFCVAAIPFDFLGKSIDASRDALAAHFGSKGYRFAIETEAVEFAEAQPWLQLKNWILVLGSSVREDDNTRCVTMLHAVGCERRLHDGCIGLALRNGDRLLLVRKAP